MRKILLCVMMCVFIAPCFGELMTRASFEAEDLGSGQWKYTYEVTNLNLTVEGTPTPIQEFTLWFDSGLYSNLVVTTAAPLSNAWDEIVWQPDPVLHDDGGYDALAELTNPGIAAGQSVKGFSVKFNWLGQGTPGSQRYEIINPDTFEILDAAITIPEPAILLLLGLGGLILPRRKESVNKQCPL